MKSFIYILGGTVLTQLLVVLFSPILSRLYSPKDFGEFSILVTFSYIFSSFFAFRLEVAILGEDDIAKKQELVSYSKYFLSINTIILTTIMFVMYYFNIINFGYLILPILVFFSVLYNIYYSYNLSLIDQKNNFIGKLLQGGGGVFSQLGLAFLLKNMYGLVLGQIIGFLIAILYLRKPKLNQKTEINITKYNDFIYIDTINSLFKVVSNHIAILLFSFLYGLSYSGAYYMASRVLMMPLATISVSLSQFISSKYIYWKKVNLVEKKLLFLCKFLIVVSFSFLIFLDNYVYEAFIFILGDQWGDAAKIAEFSIYWLCLRFIFDTISIIFSLTEYKKYITSFQVIQNFIIAALIFIGYFLKFKFIYIVEIISMVLFIYYLIGFFLFVYIYLKKYFFTLFCYFVILFSILSISLVLGGFSDFVMLIFIVGYCLIKIKEIKEFFNEN